MCGIGAIVLNAKYDTFILFVAVAYTKIAIFHASTARTGFSRGLGVIGLKNGPVILGS